MTVPIQEAIALAEQDIAANLRMRVVRATVNLVNVPDGTDYATVLPTDVAELRSVRYASPTRRYALKARTPEGLAAVRQSGTGTPGSYAVVNGLLLLDVMPDTTYPAEIIYFEKLTPLSAAAPTNATLTSASRLYLFGALKEMAPYLEHDERVALWEAKYQKAIDDENIARERAELGSAPKVISLPVVFG